MRLKYLGKYNKYSIMLIPNSQNHNSKGVVFPIIILYKTWEIYSTADIKKDVKKKDRNYKGGNWHFES